jgi:nucleotide-binding universal stress UspA family protein
MSYKTVLVHVDQSRHAPTRLRYAARLALAENAHLLGVAVTGISRFVYDDKAIDLGRTIVAAHLDVLLEKANAALRQFDELARAMGVLSCESRLLHDDAAGGMARQARYADITVLSQTDPDDPAARVVADLPQSVMLYSARPLIVLPYAGNIERMPNHILVAWDASIEATRAVACALPLLRRAGKVSVVGFTRVRDAAHGDVAEAGAEIAAFLMRHGINADLKHQSTSIDVGNALLSLAADVHADLIVMGGYGHTRFREVLLGGVTETLLHAMTVPVLLSH